LQNNIKLVAWQTNEVMLLEHSNQL